MKISGVFASTVLAGFLGVNAQDVYLSTYNGTLGLNDAAQTVDKYFGTGSDLYFSSTLQSDSYYMAELNNNADWSSMTPGNSMKWEYIEPKQNVFDYTMADKVVAFAKSLNRTVRCHTLVWHNQVPSWLSGGSWTNETLLAALTNHITNVMTHFGDDCYAWDVVNEALSDSSGYRTSFWYTITGSSYIAHAFKVANQVKQQLGLKVKLYYNDYSIEWNGGAKTTMAQTMIRDLIAQGIQVDGVGMQAHFQIGATPSKSSLVSIMNVYAAMNVEIAITELDVRGVLPVSLANQNQQSTDYASVINACKATAKCVGVTIWDFSDQYSWVPSTFSGNGFALPWYQPNGVGTPLVRKLCFDAIMNAWLGTTSAPTTATPTTATPTTTPTPTTTVTPTTTPTPTTTQTSTTAPTTTAAPTTTPTPTNTGTVPKWGQCDGLNYSGSKTCVSGTTCTYFNDWYSQCL